MPVRPTLASCMFTLCATVLADPGYYLVTVYGNAGEKTIDYRYWTVKFPNRPEIIWPELGFGYGVSERWYSEVLPATSAPIFGSVFRGHGIRFIQLSSLSSDSLHHLGSALE